MRGRYAPSPTGSLHLGNLRTALLAWLMARSAGGSFLLRIEDLDLPRVRPGSTASILADLAWLGLDYDEGPDVGGITGPFYQSAREYLYQAALGRLQAAGLVYPCYCTRAELLRIASAPQEGEDGTRYPGTCRELTDRQRRRFEAQGRSPAWRFRAPEGIVAFPDDIAGRQEGSVAERLGDFAVRRSDGVFSYQLAVVVDDALMGITQVVRGADLLPSTFRQLALFAALGYPAPTQFAHVPLLLDETGRRMAKRDAGQGLEALRSRGMARDQILGLLAASCGLSVLIQPTDLTELLASFDANRLNRLSTSWPSNMQES
ncbi:MAG: tRNA glutamyl-Q(34) synthetase GluQRS [Ktedonobacterales bacterium]